METETVATWHTLDCDGMTVRMGILYGYVCFTCGTQTVEYNGVPYAVRASKSHALRVRTRNRIMRLQIAKRANAAAQ